VRKTYVNVNGEWVEKGRARGYTSAAPEIMPDIQPYQSMVTGEIITSRSKHRLHLKDHGMVEVGNDSSLRKPYTGMPDAAPEQRKETLIREVNKFTDKEWRRMGEEHRQAVIRHMERYGKG
jgi:hypothetical protein